MMQSMIKLLFFLSLVALSQCYDHEKARRFGAYSYITYCNPNRIAKWDVGPIGQEYSGVQDIAVLQTPSQDVLAYVAFVPQDKAILIAFRGTQNLWNWVSNIEVAKTAYVKSCNCNVHDGWFGAYNSIKPQLMDQLNIYKQKYYGAKLYVIGHSLGAALATLFVGDLYESGIQTDYLQTIGSPRVGDQNFVNWFETNVIKGLGHFRITHLHDPVIHIPQPLFGYVHVNSEIYYGDDADYTVCNAGEDKNCSFDVSYNILYTGDHGTYLQLNSQKIKDSCQ